MKRSKEDEEVQQLWDEIRQSVKKRKSAEREERRAKRRRTRYAFQDWRQDLPGTVVEKSYNFMIAVHDAAAWIAKSIYYGMVPYKVDVPLETAHSNMDSFAQELEQKERVRVVVDKRDGGRKKPKSLEERLGTFGNHYFPRRDLDGLSLLALWQTALEYDLKGIVPAPRENLQDFVYRGNSLLFLHRRLREVRREPNITTKEYKVKLGLGLWASRFVGKRDLEEANKRIPYFMDLSWVVAHIKDKKDLIVPALGITFTLPQYNGFNFIQVRSEYKSREEFLSVLAHEMTHAGTVYLDTQKRFLETKAYAVGKGNSLLGEQVVSINARPPLWLSVLKFTWERLLLLPLPDRHIKLLYPKVISAVRVASNTSTYRAVRRELHELYGGRGDYILGRLNAEEMEEFRDTNNIPARIAMKRDLKWLIMKTNFERI